MLIDRSHVFLVTGYSLTNSWVDALIDNEFADDRLVIGKRVVFFLNWKLFDGVDNVHSFGHITKYRMLEIQPVGSVCFGHDFDRYFGIGLIGNLIIALGVGTHCESGQCYCYQQLHDS